MHDNPWGLRFIEGKMDCLMQYLVSNISITLHWDNLYAYAYLTVAGGRIGRRLADEHGDQTSVHQCNLHG